MAYVLGYFAADGCMSKTKRGTHFIEFVSTDIELISKTRSLLQSNHKISLRKQKSPKWKIGYRLQIGSKEMYDDLIRLGFTPAKSMNLTFPAIPLEFVHHFIRGYFDGDGHVSIAHYFRKNRNKNSVTIITGFTSGSKQFLDSLHKSLKRFAEISGGSLCYSSGYRLTFSVNDSKKIHDYLYSEANDLFLTRKKRVFEHYFNLVSGPVV